ncbi:hypothetical protein SBBP1_640053 [Burkholderiales bacterium]|nr:hypothetical protein SBBP1_640053 [Burkholderiales bacterium]
MSARRICSLDGLRGIVAIAFMLLHFDGFFLPHASRSQVVPLLDRAYLEVDRFVLRSGLVLMHVYGRKLASSNWRAP